MLAYVGKKGQQCLDITYFSRDLMASASVSVVSERAASELPVSVRTASATTFSRTRCGPLPELFRSSCFEGVRATGGFWSPETEVRGFLRLPGATSCGSGSTFVATDVRLACTSAAGCRCHGLLAGGGASTNDASDVDQDNLSELRLSLSLSRPRLDEDPRTLKVRPSSELRFILKDSKRARVAADCRWGDALEAGVECA